MGRDEISRASSPSVIAEYLQMVAMVSGEGILDVDVEKVSSRVDGWIVSLPQNLKLQVSSICFASAFCFRAAYADLRSRFVAPQLLAVDFDRNFIVFGWPMLTKFPVIVTAGPSCARIGKTG